MSIVALDGLYVGDLQLRQTRTPAELLDIVEIYQEAFPFDERRTFESMSVALALPQVCFYRVFLQDTCIGMLHFWILSHVVYGEHFALTPTVRNRGYGKHLMRTILASVEKPFLVEVEPPENAVSERRIRFYEREGLAIVKKDYVQPPYRRFFPQVSLYLMSNESLAPQVLKEVEEELRAVVYHYDEYEKSSGVEL